MISNWSGMQHFCCEQLVAAKTNSKNGTDFMPILFPLAAHQTNTTVTRSWISIAKDIVQSFVRSGAQPLGRLNLCILPRDYDSRHTASTCITFAVVYDFDLCTMFTLLHFNNRLQRGKPGGPESATAYNTSALNLVCWQVLERAVLSLEFYDNACTNDLLLRTLLEQRNKQCRR